MSHSTSFALPVLLLAVLAVPARAQNVDLHTIRVAPRGDVVVVYSKDFATCAHIMTPTQQLVHTANLWCTQANQVASVHPGSAFNASFIVGNPVKMCHGNNYGLCSPLRTITSGPTLSADGWNLSLQAGGTRAFTIDAGTPHAGRGYLMLGTASGTAGFTFGSHTIPLTPDGYFFFTLTSPNTFPLAGSAGALDPAGRATATLTLPAGLSSALIGLVLHHAFVVLSPGGIFDVSNPWPITLLQ
jgi:hypothetical protein